jgi:type IV secretion system protein VirB11
MSILLEKNLEILKPYLNKKGIVEISINTPGEIWLETEDKGWIFTKDKNLTFSKLNNLAKNLATESGQDFNDEVPMLSLSLPRYGYRLQVISGSAVDSGFALSIRVATPNKIPLSSWFTHEEIALIKSLILQRKTILISGGTGSGKTTLLNAILKLIAKTDRIITLEDSKELVITQPNYVRLLKSKTGTDIANLSYKDFINTIMRFRPDRILLGEIDIENTPNFLRLINTGHDGSFATIHANSVEGAISALVMNCILTGMKGNDETIKQYALAHIDTIIQVKKTIDVDGKRNFSAEIQEI